MRIFIIILFLGVILRVVDLGGRCFWSDEVESYEWGRQGFPSAVSELGRHSPHLPLYTGILHAWLKLYHSDSFARLLSVLFGSLTLYFAYKLALRVCSKGVALTSAFFLSISPLHIMFSRMVREYALLAFLATVSVYYLVKCLYAEKPKAADRWKYGLASLLLVYTHYYGWFIIIFQAAYLILNRKKHNLLKMHLAVTGIILILFLPWLFYHLPYIMSGKERLLTYFSSQFGLAAKALFFFYSFCLGETVYPFIFAFTVPAVLVFAALFIAGLFKTPGIMIFYFFIPVIFGMALPACAPRQIISVLPAFYTILGCGISGLGGKWKKSAAILLVSFFSGISIFNYFSNRQYLDLDMVTPWKEIAIDINSRAKPEDGIVIGAFPRPRGFFHYYKGDFLISEMRAENPGGQLADSLKSHPRIWVFLTEEPFRNESEEWMKENTEILFEKGYLLEEHTIKGLKEGFKNIHKYRSPIYKLYLCQRKG